jgi:hypothetical protein
MTKKMKTLIAYDGSDGDEAALDVPQRAGLPSVDGLVWHLLHSEREDICEVLLKEPVPAFGSEAAIQEDALSAPAWHKELLQARLRRVDDALDRLMSGSYGNCVKCGKWIEDTKLEFDPAIEFCVVCWQRKQPQDARTSLPGVALDTLAPFDTILVQTHNSHYRIFLLDPRSGRALVEGGRYFVEPVEAMVIGSMPRDSAAGCGWIGIGQRIGMWVKDSFVSTSSVQSIRVERHSSVEPALFEMSVAL